jgi:Zn-finger nucleic acid-binding protein
MPLLVCPNDGTGMQEVNRNGVLIDICPQCRGVWLDRGELEKLLSLIEERSVDVPPREERREYHHDDRDRHGGHRKKKKRSFFEMFDLD